jgi:hypothetical protein
VATEGKLIAAIGKLVDQDLRCGRVVAPETTAARALKRSKGKADLEIATAMVAQALAEKLEGQGCACARGSIPRR